MDGWCSDLCMILPCSSYNSNRLTSQTGLNCSVGVGAAVFSDAAIIRASVKEMSLSALIFCTDFSGTHFRHFFTVDTFWPTSTIVWNMSHLATNGTGGSTFTCAGAMSKLLTCKAPQRVRYVFGYRDPDITYPDESWNGWKPESENVSICVAPTARVVPDSNVDVYDSLFPEFVEYFLFTAVWEILAAYDIFRCV